MDASPGITRLQTAPPRRSGGRSKQRRLNLPTAGSTTPSRTNTPENTTSLKINVKEDINVEETTSLKLHDTSHKMVKRQTWFDYFRVTRTTTTTPKIVTKPQLWPTVLRPNMAPNENEIDELIRQMDLQRNKYMKKHTGTEQTGPEPAFSGQNQPKKKPLNPTKPTWTALCTIIAIFTTCCMTTAALLKTCTRYRGNSADTTTREHVNRHVISNPQAITDTYSDNIYDSINYPDEQQYNCHGYRPLSTTYSHYRTPRAVMGNRTLRRIDPAMDKYSITKRKSLTGHYAIEWPEAREDFLTNYKAGETQSNVEIYVPMEKQRIRKTKSADTLKSIPKTVMLLSLIMSMGSFCESQAQTLIDIKGPARSQEKISTKVAGDMLLFENYPIANRPGLIYEKIDISILDKLESDIKELTQYANRLQTQMKTTLLTAEFSCPTGNTILTETMAPKLKVPYYIDAFEIPRSPTKNYIILLSESTNTVKYCTYHLSYRLIHKLMAKHEHSTIAYYYNRVEKYHNHKAWLFHASSRTTPCQENVDVKRGEIASKHAVFSTKIETHEGALYSCSELCQNMAQQHAADKKMATQCLTPKCTNADTPDCKKWSYNWNSKTCKIASKSNPEINTAYYAGNNALTASTACGAMEQHTQIHILVNNTIREARQTCKFNSELPLGTMEIYKSCPGQSVQLKTELIPLTTLLTSYRLQLESKSDRELQNQDHDTALSLNNIKQRDTPPNAETYKWGNNIATAKVQPTIQKSTLSRSKRAIANLENQIINSLKPKLQNFIQTGLASLASSAQNLFLGNPITGAMLLIASNLVPLLIQIVLDSEDYVQIEEESTLEAQTHKNFTQWTLDKGPNLYKLSPNAPCINEPLLYENNLPKRIHDLHQLLSNLQSPLYHVLTNSQPLDDYTKTQLKDTTSNYGFWSKYNKRTKMVERYYVFAKEGELYSTQRQIAAIAGRRHSGLREGTSILGSTSLPNQPAPSWACLEVAYSNDKSQPTLPEECYDSPKLHQKQILVFPFLPHAQIVKVFDSHRIEHTCPNAVPGSIATRGLYIALYPKDCSLRLDGVEVREQDRSSKSAWNKPHIFINSITEFSPSRTPKYTDSLENRIRLLANWTTSKQITNLQLNSREEREIRYITDLLTITGLSATAASMLAIGYTILKRYYQTMSTVSSITYKKRVNDEEEPMLKILTRKLSSVPDGPNTEVSQV